MHETMHSKIRLLIHYRIANAGLLIFVFILALTACSTKKLNEINLMPAPDVYEGGAVDPFTDTDPIGKIPYNGILYATDRSPAKENHHFYKNKRGNLLRLGVAKIKAGKEDITWEEARRISLLKNRPVNYPLKVTEVKELGVLDRSITVFTPPDLITKDLYQPANRFAELVNEKLKQSERKDIYIYVHGYKVVFENPVLVATELWHFLGYDGVFIAYAWPSTPKTLAYVSDAETAAISSHFLQIFLQYLAEETDAKNIHIVGYSAGTRVVISALAQLAMMTTDQDKAAIQRKLRIGHVILTASDFDRQLFGIQLVKGLLKVPRTLTVYVSESDSALGFSRWLFGRERLGQMWKDRKLPEIVAKYLQQRQELILIDVTDAEAATAGNGHAYFRKSPWTSSDILMTLMHDLRPDERGLVRSEDIPIWTFPPDYIQRLRAALLKVLPDAKKSLE
jgi:esterase/lipase superfamily enzyme